MDKTALTDTFEKLAQLHVVVVGDVMLDNYRWGDVERMSPEAPVPVITVRNKESRLGGAANVALNCRALGAKVALAGVVGDDADGKLLAQLANNAGINTDLLMNSKKRPTTSKTRIISRNQHMMRLDDEVSDELSTEEEHPFIDTVLRYLQREKPNVLIFEDYNKGVLKENVIQRITAHCREIGIVIAVDPKKHNFLGYKNVDIFKPNLKEVREGLNMPISEVGKPELDKVHDKLVSALHHKVTFITLSEYGVYYNDGQHAAILPTHIRNIADVSGAGDTVIAVAAMVYAITRDANLMADMANLAGGLVCEEVGVVPLDKQRFYSECAALLT
ncbi:MAG: carbohydrate kinase [Bacteroidetes bacterium]|nr:carbohydrate kinase [Bacteroidota bacterium]